MSEPSVKRIKTDPLGDVSELPVKSDETAADDEDMHDDDDEPITVIVEFKFCSCKTNLLEEGQMTGVLHVPMVQNHQTGRFRIPAGTTEANGIAKFDYIRFHGLNKWNFENPFTATFERRDATSPIQTFKLGYHLTGNSEESGFCPALVNSQDEYEKPLNPDYRYIYSEFQTYPVDKEQRNVDTIPYQIRLNTWEANAGGMLTVFAHAEIDDCFLEMVGDYEKSRYEEDSVWKANYKIKLYTTLSAHSPNETNFTFEEEAVPQWDRLEDLMIARFPGKDASWAKRAVKNYVYFLDMKKEHNDWNSELFSPSKWIDEVWHAHLSFTDRYQQDMMAYCGHIIEHSPVLGIRAYHQYHMAHDKYVARMKRLNDRVDDEFWPVPRGEKERVQSRQHHDGDSDDCCYLPDFSNCG